MIWYILGIIIYLAMWVVANVVAVKIIAARHEENMKSIFDPNATEEDLKKPLSKKHRGWFIICKIVAIPLWFIIDCIAGIVFLIAYLFGKDKNQTGQ